MCSSGMQINPDKNTVMRVTASAIMIILYGWSMKTLNQPQIITYFERVHKFETCSLGFFLKCYKFKNVTGRNASDCFMTTLWFSGVEVCNILRESI